MFEDLTTHQVLLNLIPPSTSSQKLKLANLSQFSNSHVSGLTGLADSNAKHESLILDFLNLT